MGKVESILYFFKITGGIEMKHSLKYAERGIQLKVLDISEHICIYGSNQLRKFGIQKGTVLEINPAFVSQVLIDLKGRDVLLGYESAQMILIGDKRLTELKRGESGQLSDFEGGYEAYRRFKELGMKEGIEIILKAYPYLGEQYVKLQGVKIMKNDMRELLKLPAVEYIIVDVKGLEKQVSLMGIGESGTIRKVIADKGKREKLDREWIHEGNTIEIMHRSDPDSIPLMVRIDNKSHIIGAGLTEKIFVEEA